MRKTMGFIFVAVLAGVCTDIAAAPAAALDVSKLKSTNLYAILQQDHTFIDVQLPGQYYDPTHGGPVPLALVPTVALGVALGNYIANSGAVAGVQAVSYPYHYVVDPYDAESAVRQGFADGIKSVPWLQGAKLTSSKDTSDSVARLTSANAGADSVATVQFYYSATPDYSGIVVAAVVKIYSSALSPAKYNPYDPDSKFLWLKQPVLMRTCVYQSKLLGIPGKTPEIKQQLQAVADKEFDVVNLKRDAAAMDPYTTPLNKRSSIETRVRQYTAVSKAIEAPNWGPLDGQMIYALSWTGDGGAAYKQALHDGATKLAGLIAMSVNPPPADAKLLTKDPAGKNDLYQLNGPEGDEVYFYTAGFLFSAPAGTSMDIGSIFIL